MKIKVEINKIETNSEKQWNEQLENVNKNSQLNRKKIKLPEIDKRHLQNK
jgi:hypothetical protein